MEKGWNNEYLISKKENLINKRNIFNKKDIDEDLELTELLMLKLLFSDGKVIENDITFKKFFEYIKGCKCINKLNSKDLDKMFKFASFFSKLPVLEISEKREKISVDDSINILKDYFKDRFEKRHYDVFKNSFIKNKEYVLYDKNSDLSKVIFTDNEIFTLISKTEDIKMLSSMAHETGHIYKILNTKKYFQSCFGEYESFFFELNLLIWLIKNNIYKEDATNYFLSLFKLMEQIVKMRCFIEKYKTNKIDDINELKKLLKQLDIKNSLNLKDNEELYNLYITTLNLDIKKYFYSFISVLNNLEGPNSIETYENVINNLDKKENFIKKRILSNQNEIKSYIKYRNLNF